MRQLWLTLLAVVLGMAPAGASTDTDQHIALGDAAYERRDFEEALSHYRAVMDDYRHGVTAPRMGDAMNWAGNASMNLSHYIDALEFYTLGIELSQQSSDSRLYRDLLSNIGTVFAIFKDYERAVYYFEKAYTEAQQQRDSYLISVAITNLAAAYSKLGEADKASAFLKLQQQYALQQPGLQQFFLNYNRGLAALASGDAHGAIYNLNQGLRTIDEHALSSSYRTDIYNELGEAYALLDLCDSAINYYKLTAAICRRGHYQDQRRDAYKGLEHLYMLKGMRDSAIDCQSVYIALTDSFFNQRQFNAAKDRLMKFEQQMETDSRQTLNSQINRQWLVIVVISLLLIAVVAFALTIAHYNQNLRSAHRMLMRKHDELMRTQEETNALRDTYLSALNTQHPSPDTQHPSPDTQHPSPDTGYPLSQERREQLLRDIVEVMENIEIISAPDFNLHMLAKLVESNTKYVSLVINDTYHKNFKTILNEYRIREACQRFTETEKYGNLTIQGIATELGYNSTNGFIVAFKKIIGMTPSVYIKLARERQEQEG